MTENLCLLDLIPEGDNMHVNILKALEYSAIKTLLTQLSWHLSQIFVHPAVEDTLGVYFPKPGFLNLSIIDILGWITFLL